MYDIEKQDGGWAVIDSSTGLPASVDGVPQTDLEMEDADDLADLLNLLLHERPERTN